MDNTQQTGVGDDQQVTGQVQAGDDNTQAGGTATAGTNDDQKKGQIDKEDNDIITEEFDDNKKGTIHQTYYQQYQQELESGVYKAPQIDLPVNDKIKYDQGYFVWLWSGSVSLTKEEKKQVLESVGRLSQFQIDELIKIFEEEKYKFNKLNVKHDNKLSYVQQDRAGEMQMLEMDGQKEEVAKKDEEDLASLMGELDGLKADDYEQKEAA